jgi:L-fuculose-phosphate aldolase
LTEKSQQEVFLRLKRVGAAIARINSNNTHSGNLSMRDPDDSDIFYITSSGSQCGELILQDIVPVRFSGVSWGDARVSTESTIHRKILNLPGVQSVVHAHYLNSTFISFDNREKQLFLQFLGTDSKGREEFLFHPVDLYGSFVIGGVRVASYFQPVGSEEMEERIPEYLKKDRLTIVRGHGPFVRASAPEEALHYLSVLENSTKLVLLLKRRGIDVVAVQKDITRQSPDTFFPAKPHFYKDIDFSTHEVDDQTVVDDFKQRLIYNYNNQLSAYGTGSMSQKVSSREMIYCPLSAVPEDFEFPLYRVTLDSLDEDPLDCKVHKMIYRHTHLNTCMITTSPMAAAEGMAILAEDHGAGVLLNRSVKIGYAPDDHPAILPIDAEAIYLNPKVGLVDLSQLKDLSSQNPILNMLRWYKGCCVVAGYGVISAGETTLEQAAHNASSAERIAQFRAQVFINEKLLDGPSVHSFEP